MSLILAQNERLVTCLTCKLNGFAQNRGERVSNAEEIYLIVGDLNTGLKGQYFACYKICLSKIR